MNHYEMLGVSPAASYNEIKKAYRKLAKKYHPDVNPSQGSFDKIRLLNEAYEVLSDSEDRDLYDRVLQGEPVSFPIAPEDPYEKYRREYRHWRAEKERKHVEYLIKVKARFYRYERFFNMLFFVFAALLTLDYYYHSRDEVVKIDKVVPNTDGEAKIVTASGDWFTASQTFYQDYISLRPRELVVSYSLFFDIPSVIEIARKNRKHNLYMDIHIYHNVFSIIIFIFSAVVIKHSEYSDFRLSCGLVPCFIVLFLLLFLASDPSTYY